MSKITELEKLPEISFIGNLSLDEIKNQVKVWYNERYRELTGKTPTLSDAAPEMLLQYAIAMLGGQAMQYIQDKGNGEMLATSYGAYLDQLAANFGVARRAAERATVTLRFTLADTRAAAVGIPAGTRVRTEGGIYFNTTDYAEIKAGELTADVLAQAEEAGVGSSGVEVGTINTLVDPIAYMQSVTNLEESHGGTDEEDDDALTERVYLAPSVFSCAGPADAYVYYAKAWRNDVMDVKIDSPEPCEVDIYFLLDGGRLPTETELNEMQAYFADESQVKRPLTDKVVCKAPTEVGYTIDLTYYIGSDNRNNVAGVQNAVDQAVNEYKTWQRKLGRDINPTELIACVRQAGAKRVRLTAPVDTVVSPAAIARCDGETVNYGGLEDD